MTLNASSRSLNLAPLGIPTLIIADDPQLIAAAKTAYPHWAAEAVPEPRIELRLETGRASSADISLAIHVEGSRLQLSGGGVRGSADCATGTAEATLSKDIANDPQRFAEVCDTLLLFLLARSGRTPVHAAAFMMGDLALVLAGPSGSGKSTLALAAAGRGLPVLSDDTVFVQREPSFELWGFPRAIHVFPQDAPAGDHLLRDRNGKTKAALPHESPALEAHRAVLILLERGASLGLDQVDSAAAVDQLMHLDEGFDLLAEESRAAFEALAAQSGCWRLTLGEDPAEAIEFLIRRFARQAHDTL